MSDLPDDKEVSELINAHLDDSLTDQQFDRLSNWIRASSENASTFARAAMLHDRLREDLRKTPSATTNPAKFTTTKNGQNNGRAASSRVIAAVIAVCLILAFVLNLQQRDATNTEGQSIADTTTSTFARVALVVNVDMGTETLQPGDRLGAETIRFNSGLIRLQFDNGVDVTLEGPAEYEISAVGQTKLFSGTLVANVPPGAEGFRVDTPSAEVVDLGTSFGLDVGADGVADVLVFDGEIEVTSTAGKIPQRLHEGESIRLNAAGDAELSEFNANAFEKLWPVSSGIAGSSDSFRFLPPWPKRIRFIQSDEDIFVAAEGNAVELTRELAVNISEPGRCESVNDLIPVDLEPGRIVRSYLLHYMPASQLGARRAKRMTGSITFERPVAGLIVQHDELLASSRRFTRRTAGEGHQRRQVDLIENGDRITLSDDRRTITVDLISRGRSSDLVRVIVDAELPRRPNRDVRQPATAEQ